MDLTAIIQKTYVFSNDVSGYLGEIYFEPNGTIGRYNHPNERTWTFEDKCLIVWGESKKRQAKYNQCWKKNGKWHMEALWDQEGNKHYLV